MTDPAGLDAALAKLEKHLLAQWIPIQNLGGHAQAKRSVGFIPSMLFRVRSVLEGLLRRFLQ